VFSPELRTKAEELVGRYPVSRSALLPLLHLVQHADGHLSADGIAECAELLGLTRAEVAAVATFYTMYKREPLGEHLVSVCTNFSCKVRGAGEVYQRLSDKLGVGHNGTTADGRFTLEHAECLGNCEGAPVVTVDYLNYECLTPDAAEELVDRIAAGEVPPPTRGFVPPGIHEVQYRLAGLGALTPARGPAEVGHARAGDGAAPGREPAAAAVPTAEEQAAQRDDAKRAVREVGQDPDEVERVAGGRSREFPTRDPNEVGGDIPGAGAPGEEGSQGG
jgi:NADH-quinone oxidoreductase subunit E